MSQLNAAGRLCDVLESICEDVQPGTSAYESIGKALGISNLQTDLTELTKLFELLGAVEENIRSLKNTERSQRYLASIIEFHKFLIQHGLWQITSENLCNFINQNNLVLIFDACASYIAQEQLEHDLTEEQLKDFLKQAESLLNEVVDSDLQPDIKKYLIVRLEEICTAMRHYSTGGAQYLSLVVDASIGGLFLRQNHISQDKEKPVLSKLLRFLLELGGIIDLGANIQGFVMPKIEQIVNLVLSPGQ